MKLSNFSNFLFKICLLFALIECIICVKEASGSGQQGRGRRGRGRGRGRVTPNVHNINFNLSNTEQPDNVETYLYPIEQQEITFQGQIGEGSGQQRSVRGRGRRSERTVPGRGVQELAVEGSNIPGPSGEGPSGTTGRRILPRPTPSNPITYKLINPIYNSSTFHTFTNEDQQTEFMRSVPRQTPPLQFQRVTNVRHEPPHRSNFADIAGPSNQNRSVPRSDVPDINLTPEESGDVQGDN